MPTSRPKRAPSRAAGPLLPASRTPCIRARTETARGTSSLAACRPRAGLDSGLLEFRRGCQGFPDPANRYGTDELDGFYPLRTLAVYPLDALSDPDAIVADMRRTCDAEDARHPRLGLLPPHIFAP